MRSHLALLRASRMLAPVLLAFALGLIPGRAGAVEDAVPVENPGFEQGGAGWRLPAAFAVVEDEAHTGRHSLRIHNPDAKAYPLAAQTVPARVGMRYRFAAWVKTKGVQGQDNGATLCMEWQGDEKYLGGAYPTGVKGDSDWTRIEGVTAPIPAEARQVSLTLYLRKGMTGTAWFDDVSIEVVYPPALDAALLRPNYRGQLWADASDQRILVRACVGERMKGGLRPEQTTLTAVLLQGERAVRAHSVRRPKAGEVDVTFDGKRLPEGRYRLRVELRAPDGLLLASREFPVEKLPASAPRPRVMIDEHNRTLVDGKPYFPLGWYFGPGPSSKDYPEHLDRIAASPFNTIMTYGINTGSLETVRTYLDDMDRRDLKLIYSLKDIFVGTKYYRSPQFGFHGEEEIVRGVVGAFREHPAVLGWYLNDELPITLRDRLEARGRLVRELDADHPTWAVLYQVADLFGYLNTADVLGTDPYPVPKRPVTLAAEWTRQTAAVSGGERPLWQVPQAFDWGNYHKEQADEYRAPTRDEIMVMSYLCLINGARGLIYYAYSDLLRDRLGFDARWADMLVVGREVEQLFPALLSTARPPKLKVESDSDAVASALRADDAGNHYVLLANPDPKAGATVRVSVPARAETLLLRNAETQPLPAGAQANLRAVELPPMGAATLILHAER